MFLFRTCRQKNLKYAYFGADAEPTPDVLWPHVNEIVCSAVSGCTRYIAVGLSDSLVSVWDRKLGESTA